MNARRAAFLINLPQDVNTLRPLVHIAARDLGMRTDILVSDAFAKRDRQNIWRDEIAEIAGLTGSSVTIYASEWDVLQRLQGGRGVLVAGSESTLHGHAQTHDVFRAAPPGFLRIVLQHGFECVGFRQSRDHDIAHGRTVTFAADVACGWQPAARLTHLVPSQRGKLWVTGPTAVLQTPPPAGPEQPARGIVCENMHSVRLSAAGDFKVDFISIFGAFSRALRESGRTVTLRPHPGGQYFLKNNLPLEDNVAVNISPIYRVDLSRFAYGISAPSSVLVDMALAGAPTAVWRDAGGTMDADAYGSMESVSSLQDWLAFAERAVTDRAGYQARQAAFFAREELVVDPAIVYGRFAALLAGATRIEASSQRGTQTGAGAKGGRRVLLVSPDSAMPTVRINFERPLAAASARGEIVLERLDETMMRAALGKVPEAAAQRAWLERRILDFRPELIVFCRYAGPGVETMLALADQLEAATLLHIDDDLLDVPDIIGAGKRAFHNDPERTASLRRLLGGVDLVWCSTPALRDRLAAREGCATALCGEISCASPVLRAAEERPVRVMGYMGVGHARDFALIAPVVAAFLRRNPQVRFELLGKFPPQPELEAFGARFVRHPAIPDFDAFVAAFPDLGWDIGLCPLEPHPFNLTKTEIKWVDYTAAGVAVVASRGTIYDAVCAEGCGDLADTPEAWLAAMERLCDPRARFEQVSRAQARLREVYAPERMARQAIAMFDRAAAQARSQGR